MASLNEMQNIACHHVDGPLLILAGAGSGKTRVITHRVAYLMEEEGINPYNILAITFTNKAAAEMRDRVNNIVGEGAERVWVSTFHSLCVRILRRFADRLDYGTNFNIYDSDDQKTAIKHILKELNIDSKKYPEKMFLAEISKAKERYISPNEYSRANALDYHKTQIANVYTEYMERLKKYNAFDFDDLIYKTVELFEHNPDVLELYQDRFRYIMVDEYQDTNHIQFLFVKLLARKYRNLCVVGDDDQSIYKFRGANITNILNFENEYPDTKVIKLEQNYRSCGNILSAANAVIKHNAGRKDKALWTERDGGEKLSFNICDDEYMEADRVVNEIIKLAGTGVPYRDMAILYRTNAQSRIFGEKLVLRGVPHRVYGGQNFYERKEIKDIMAYLKVINNDADDTYIRRIINVPKRGIGDASVDKAVIYANVNKITIMEALHDVDNIPGLSRAAGKIKGFVELIDSFKAMLNEQESLDSIFDRILEDTGYEAELIAENTDEATSRLENIDELRNRVIQFQEDNEEATLSDFLEDTALVSETDKMSEDDNMVRLMTLHGAKGLEFPYVFMCGMEERIFPSAMAINSEDEDALEEERRLCYVGITRAMKKLYLSAARFRMMHGQRNINDISRFINEIPPLLIDDAGEIARINRRREERSYMDGGYNRNSYGNSGNGSYSSNNMNGASYSGYNNNIGNNVSYGGYNKSNPYNSYKNNISGTQNNSSTIYNSGRNARKEAVSITPSAKPAFGKEFVVNKVLELNYAEGDRVRHIKYGNGTVTQIVQGGKDYEVTVDFDRCGPRKMFASFAKLQKI